MNRQVHGAVVNRATAGERGEPGDGLWTGEPGVPMLKLDRRLPAGGARRGRTGRRRSRSCTPAGAAFSRASSTARCRRARREPGRRSDRARDRAVLLRGRATDVAAPTARASATASSRGSNLDLWTAAERALREAGVDAVERIDLCTACHPELFFSHRRDGGVTGRQGVIALCRLSAIRAAYERDPRGGRAGRHGRRGDEVRLRSRTWPCSPRRASRSWARTARRSCERKHAEYGDAFRWHFIGHLQSNKAKVVDRDLRARPLARLRVGRAAARPFRRSSRSTSPARRPSPGIAPEELPAFLELYARGRAA